MDAPDAPKWKGLHWIRQMRVPVTLGTAASPSHAAALTTRERLVAALADQPRTVAQLAHAFGLSQPTMLEHVRRALRDGLIREVQVPEERKRFAAERYYATAVPVIREPDRDLLVSGCRALADEIAAVVSAGQGDLRAAFAMTHLAREGWSFDELWPYLQETIWRLTRERVPDLVDLTPPRPHGLAWVEDLAGDDAPHEWEEQLA